MGTKYTSQSASGYDATPPSDDGTVSEANKLKWSTIKTKLADTIKSLADNINTALTTHFDLGPTALTTNTTLSGTHYGQFIQVSGSPVTLTLTDAATLTAGWYCRIRVTGSSNVTLSRATGADTINGTAADITLAVGDTGVVYVNAATNGFFTEGFHLSLVQTNIAAKTDTATRTMSGASINLAAFLDVASSGTTNIGAAASNQIRITGTTTITAFDSVAAGISRSVRFASALILTYNATSLILPGLANITTLADDCAEFTSLGSGNWICTKYLRSDGRAVKGGKLEFLASGVASSSAAIDLTAGIGSTYDEYVVFGSGIRPATNTVHCILRFSTDGGSTFKAGASDYYDTSAGAAATSVDCFATGAGGTLSNVSPAALNFQATFYGFNSTSTFRHGVYIDSVYTDGSTVWQTKTNAGGSLANMAAAVNGIRFLMSSGNIAEGTFYLFGVKNS